MSDFCIIVLPGGGFHHINKTTEGLHVVDFFRSHDLHSQIYEYKTLDKFSLHDSINDLISFFTDLRNTYSKIGVCGFSAGAFLASHIIHLCDFAILTYGILNLQSEWNHYGSLDFFSSMFKHDHDDLPQICPLSQLSPSSCKVFLYHSILDFIVHPLNSILFHEKLLELNMISSLHLSNKGKHGDGLNSPNWTNRVLEFIETL